MAWTSKVANLVQSKASSALQGVLGNQLTSALGLANSQQTTKVAAKLLNKSPLEIGDVKPTAHMEQNPYQYGTVYYPTETANLGEGHYIIFDVVAHKSSKFKTATSQNGLIQQTGESTLVGEKTANVDDDGSVYYTNSNSQKNQTDRISGIKSRGVVNSNRLRGVNSGLFKYAESNHNYISDSIILYMPPEGVKFEYGVDYEQTATDLAGDLAQGLAGVVNEAGFADKIAALDKGVVGVGSEVGKKAIFAAVSIIPGFENAQAVYDKFKGQAKNPNMEMVFKSVKFRNFSFPFTFAPRDTQEKDNVEKILQLFRFHMLPEHQAQNNGYFNVPSEFQITYMYRDQENTYLPKISRCVLTDVSIDYAPEGVISTFSPDDRGAPPVLTKMNLSFTETEIMTKETVALGF